MSILHETDKLNTLMKELEQIAIRNAPYTPFFINLIGSYAYGDFKDDSDIDAFVLVIAPLEKYCSITSELQEVSHVQEERFDIVYYELSKVLKLLRKGNHNIFLNIFSTPIAIYNEDVYSMMKNVALRSVNENTFRGLWRQSEVMDERHCNRYKRVLNFMQSCRNRGELIFFKPEIIRHISPARNLLIPSWAKEQQYVPWDSINYNLRRRKWKI